METVSLKFNSKKQLLDFYSHLENTYCTIDLQELVISSAFSDELIHLAVKNYGVRIFVESPVY